MSVSPAIIAALSVVLSCYSTGQTQPCPAAKMPPRGSPPRDISVFRRPPFHVEVERDRKDGTRFILTNNYQEPLTAYVEEITPVPDGKEGGVQHHFHIVDALIRTTELVSPIPYGLSTINYVSRNVGRADAKPGIAAAVWEDGLMYGPPDLIQKVVARRERSLLYHQHAIDLLQFGLKEHWDANRFVAEGRSREEGLPVTDVDPELNLIIEFPLAIAVDNLMRIRRENPDNIWRAAQQMLDQELKEKAALDSGLSTMKNPLPSAPFMCAQ